MGRNISVEAGIKIEAAKTVKEGDNIKRDLRGDLVNLIDNLNDIQISISSAKPELYDELEIVNDLDLDLDLGTA